MKAQLEAKYPVYPSVAEMLAPESMSRIISHPVTQVYREAINEHSGLAGSTLSKVRTNAGNFILKEMSIKRDWIMYSTDDMQCRSVTLWQYGLLDELLPDIEHRILGCARTADGGAILMEDLSGKFHTWDAPMPPKLVPKYLDALAKIHASFWNDARLEDERLGLLEAQNFLSWVTMSLTSDDGSRGVLPEWIRGGWDAIADILEPDVLEQIRSLIADATPVIKALERYPYTLLHGDYRAENLAYLDHAVIIDWQRAARSLMTLDFSWLAKNGYIEDVLDRELAQAYYRGRLEAYLGKPFKDALWKEMIDLGYAVDALNSVFFNGFFYTLEHDPEEIREINKQAVIQMGNYVMDAQYLL